MKTKILILGLLCFLVIPLLAKETVVFESVLKDAIFSGGGATLEHIGWWTLKFENGAVIRVERRTLDFPKDEIFWIGKKYQVSKKGFGENNFFVKLIEEGEKEQAEKKEA
jgi:hypothetical protein